MDQTRGGPGFDDAEVRGDGDPVAGVEVVSYLKADRGVRVDLAGNVGNLVGKRRLDHLGRAVSDVLGSPLADILRGDETRDGLYGEDGDDGDDDLAGGGGADLLSGNSGRDLLAVGSGNAVLYGGHGFDRIDGGPGYDICTLGRQVATGCESHLV
jgi:Ca2+-binding RTX toxin-like protein